MLLDPKSTCKKQLYRVVTESGRDYGNVLFLYLHGDYMYVFTL